MKQLLYNIDALLIIGVLFVLMFAAIEAGYRFGVRRKDSATEMTRDHLSAIQASILGVMGLLLAFTFSLSVQRFDTRSDAAVDEANAIGTAYLRTQLLPPALRSDVQMLLRDYVDLRVQASDVSMVSKGEWEALQAKVAVSHAALWDYARRAAELNPNPVISGLFIQALNEMIDSYGRNVAQVSRTVPQPVLILLFGTLLVAARGGGIDGRLRRPAAVPGQFRDDHPDPGPDLRHPRPRPPPARPDHGEQPEPARPAGVDQGAYPAARWRRAPGKRRPALTLGWVAATSAAVSVTSQEK